MGFGQLPYDMAHLLGGGVLLLSFVLLYQRRIGAVINALACQGALLGLTAAWQGFAQGQASLYVTAAIALIAKTVLIPLALHRIVRRLSLHRTVEVALGIGPSMVAGVALVGLAVLNTLPAAGTGHAGPTALQREDLALAMSVVLLGMLMMITRRNAISQIVGLMSLENGLILAAVSVAGMPLVVELSTAGLVLIMAVIAGVFVFHIRERFNSVDTAFLESHRGERR
ncbi:hydrogenase-4 component E [Acetobacteraceae bacterium H6797]|nr:hydrogenase-4 component E [Acetobacteraceae bacterium H6797]